MNCAAVWLGMCSIGAIDSPIRSSGWKRRMLEGIFAGQEWNVFLGEGLLTHATTGLVHVLVEI